MYFFSLCMKAPGRSPDNPRRCNDTRYSLSRRLCASTLAAFVAEPLGGTTSRALKKKRNKGLAAASEGIRAKLIWIQQCEHIGGVFSFTGGTNRTERAGLQVKAGFFVFKDVKKKKYNRKKNESDHVKCPFLSCCDLKIKQKLQCFHLLIHLLYTFVFGKFQ